MREIKFRVWDKVNKKYYRECDFLSFRPGGIRFMWTDYEEDEQMVTDLPNGSFELLQFTGLHDKNGVEIYEGDVLREQDAVVDIFMVEWHVNDIDCGWNISPSDTWYSEVIGNIHDNPELLEV